MLVDTEVCYSIVRGGAGLQSDSLDSTHSTAEGHRILNSFTRMSLCDGSCVVLTFST